MVLISKRDGLFVDLSYCFIELNLDNALDFVFNDLGTRGC